MRVDPEISKVKKNQATLSSSTNRDELIAAGVCVACRALPAAPGGIHCGKCRYQIEMADRPRLRAKLD